MQAYLTRLVELRAAAGMGDLDALIRSEEAIRAL